HNVHHELEGSGANWTGAGIILQCLYSFYYANDLHTGIVSNMREERILVDETRGVALSDTMDEQEEKEQLEAPKTNLYSPIKILLVRKWALQRLLIVMLTGFGIGIVYYSMPLAVGNLGFNIYLSVAFNALAEIPSYIIFSFIVSKWSRKGSLLAFTTLGGICSIMCIMNWKEVVLIGLELVSYFSACTAFIMLMIYTLELFPTCVRNGASSMVRQAPVFGAVFSPILISAGRSNKVLSYGVFGLVILCSSVFVFCLPETRGVALSDTMDEQEEKEQLAM
ncbi:PREDICTED: organic cation/carnitine transporter 3-like, partial [Populus euphratica]|uniref:Organic cation/carnitine transporter 3-like n=1 Tax=Populus euphratica TaxID=75702 RepID=A0AAJ6XBK7_POPEU